MFRLAFLPGLALPLAVLAQQPVPASSPYYKALYEQANDAAAKWKARADELQDAGKRLSALAQASLDRENAEHEHVLALERQLKAAGSTPAVASPPPSKTETNRFVLAPKQHVHLLKYGGPNEFMIFLGVDALAVHLRIGVGDGEPVDVPVKRSFQGTAGNRTPVYSDGHGCAVYYVDDIKTPAGCGTFEADFAPDALYRQQAGAAQRAKTDGVGTISHYSGNP